MFLWRRTAVSPLLAALLLAGSGGAGALESRLDATSDCLEQHVELAPLPGGGFVAVWLGSAVPGSLNGPRVFARLFGPDGAPLGGEVQVNGDADALVPAVAANAAGDFLVVWGEASGNLRSRLFRAGGDPGPVLPIAPVRPAGDVAVVAEGGGFAVLAGENSAATLWRLDAGGQVQSTRVFEADNPSRGVISRSASAGPTTPATPAKGRPCRSPPTPATSGSSARTTSS